MMKWKVTKNARCASADRSLDYLRTEALNPRPKKEAAPHPPPACKKEIDLSRKPSFVATDCINLKGIFGLSKDRGETNFSSLTTQNGERQRSRSEIRSSSIDRLAIGYLGGFSKGPKLTDENEKKHNKAKNTRSSSPTDRAGCWVRGRRREREPRKSALGVVCSEGKTVVAGSATRKKSADTRTTLDGTEPGNKSKLQRNGKHSLEGEKLNDASRKKPNANKENNNNVDMSNQNLVVYAEICHDQTNNPSESTSREVRVEPIKMNRNKGIAPKPKVRQSLFKDTTKMDSCLENNVVTQTGSANESVFHSSVGAENGIKGENSNYASSEFSSTPIAVVEPNSSFLWTTNKNSRNVQSVDKNLNESCASILTVTAEVYNEVKSPNKDLNTSKTNELVIEETIETFKSENTVEDVKSREHNELQNSVSSKKKSVLLLKNRLPKKRDLPIIDEPDYSPLNSEDEAENSTKTEYSNLSEKSACGKDRGPAVKIHNEVSLDIVQNVLKQEKKIEMELHEESGSSSEAVDVCEKSTNFTEMQLKKISTEIINPSIASGKRRKGQNNKEHVDKSIEDPDFNMDDKDYQRVDAIESKTGQPSTGCTNNGTTEVMDSEVTSTESLIANVNKNYESEGIAIDTDLPIKLSSSSLSLSPTPPPRKKMAAHQSMTVNVVVRNPLPASETKHSFTNLTNEEEASPSSFVVKKSFVLTVAKQEKGFQSLCANKEPSCNSDSCKKDDQQISVTFLCSGPQPTQWIDEASLNSLKLRSLSVPPNSGKHKDIMTLTPTRSCSKERKSKERQSSKRKNHKSRKRDTIFHMPQAVIDELSLVLETRKRSLDDEDS